MSLLGGLPFVQEACSQALHLCWFLHCSRATLRVHTIFKTLEAEQTAAVLHPLRSVVTNTVKFSIFCWPLLDLAGLESHTLTYPDEFFACF